VTLRNLVVLLSTLEGMLVIFTLNGKAVDRVARGVVGSIVGVDRGVERAIDVGIFTGVEAFMFVVLFAIDVCDGDDCLNRLLIRNIQTILDIKTVAKAMKNTLYAGSERHKLTSLEKRGVDRVDGWS
jgi:hypothetical protein